MTIAILDVAYNDTGALAACVVSKEWNSPTAMAGYVKQIDSVQPYEPGQFYRRELPCLISVLSLLPSMASVLVIDGYVWLASVDRPGLGAHLYQAIGGQTPVIGIAKTAFVGVDDSSVVIPVTRGKSTNPLFVTAVGMDVHQAAQAVHGMHGPHRIPDLLRVADQLSRGISWQDSEMGLR